MHSAVYHYYPKTRIYVYETLYVPTDVNQALKFWSGVVGAGGGGVESGCRNVDLKLLGEG